MPGFTQEDQLGALRASGILQREVPGYDPGEAAARVQRSQPFLEQLSPAATLNKGGIEDKIRDARVRDVLRQIYRVGVNSVTVINIMPWGLDVQVGVFNHFVKRADWKKGEEIHVRTFDIKDVRVDMCDMGDGKYSPMALLPVDIADEFLRKYVGKEGEIDTDESGQQINNKPGGVFVFVGSEVGRDITNEKFAEEVKGAHERLERWFWAQYKMGMANWERYKHDPLQITERNKDSAKYLYKHGLIDSIPEWAAIGKGEAGTKNCPNCAESIKKAAKQCRFCGAVIHADNTYSRTGEFVRPPQPDPEPPQAPPPSAPVVPVSTEPELSDRQILDLPDESLPEPKPARPNKPRRQGGQE